MDYTYNITFIIEPEAESRFLDWTREILIPELFNQESPARNAALRKVVEAGGEKPAEDHGLSIALHAEFENEKVAKEWHDIFLAPALGKFTTAFGPNAMYFLTLLENIPL